MLPQGIDKKPIIVYKSPHMSNGERGTGEQSSLEVKMETVEAVRKQLKLYGRAVLSIENEKKALMLEEPGGRPRSGRYQQLQELQRNMTIMIFGMVQVFGAFTGKEFSQTKPASVDFLDDRNLKRHLLDAELHHE